MSECFQRMLPENKQRKKKKFIFAIFHKNKDKKKCIYLTERKLRLRNISIVLSIHDYYYRVCDTALPIDLHMPVLHLSHHPPVKCIRIFLFVKQQRIQLLLEESTLLPEK